MTVPAPRPSGKKHGARALLDQLRVAAAALVLCAGVAASIGASLYVRRVEQRRIQHDFEQRASLLAVILQRRLDQNLEMLESVRNFYAASREVERREFQNFVTGTLRDHAEIWSLDWRPRVQGEERAAFEAAARQEGLADLADFEIRDADAQRRLVRAQERQDYFPVYYAEPFDRLAEVLGYDGASEPMRREAMERARDTGRAAATPAVEMLVGGAGSTERLGCIIFLPIYRNGLPHETLEDRRRHLAGFVAVVYQARLFMEGALTGLETEEMDLHLYDDPAVPEERRLLYDTDDSLSLGARQASERTVRADFFWETELTVADRRWSLLCYPGQRVLMAEANWRAAKVLLVGLALVLLLAGYLAIALNRTGQIERLVATKTAELSTANTRLQVEVEQRVSAERALRFAHDHMEQVLNAMTSLLISVDLQGRITRWNGTAEALLGLREDDVRHRPLADQLLSWERARMGEAIAACQREERSVRMDDMPFTHPDGREGWLGLTLTPVRDSDDRVTGCLILGADVTQRRQLERERSEQTDALTRSHVELQHREQVMRSLLDDLQTTKQHMEEQTAVLTAANAKLKELAAVKDEFVAKASHELRTPLTAIKEGISLMLDAALGPINDEQKDFMNTVDENIDRLTELISNMLDISKIEAGRMRLQRRRVDLRQLLETTLSSYRAFAGKRTLTTEPGEVPHVFADSNRIIQVLGNFISNAVKFTPADGAITLSLALRDGVVAVSVKDNGMGITQDDVPKLFKKFSQVGEGQNKLRGTGLGLALCKELVELHRGAITVDSVPGAGTTFTFTLPVHTSSFVLEESFAELVEAAVANQQEAVALVAIDNEPLLGRWPQAQADQRVWHLEQVVDVVRKHLHRGDVVLAIEPHWVVVLAIADAEGAQAMMSRLRPALREWSDALVGTSESAPVNFGAAVYPLDGTSVHDLFANATHQLNRGLAAVQGRP